MYAKLVNPGTAASSLLIRDIVRLCTSSSPTTSLLSGFTAGSSAIVDSTPAGWTYTYSNVDLGTLGNAANGASSGTADWWAMNALCNDGVTQKYAKLTCNFSGSSTTGLFHLTGASNVVTTTVTNEGLRGLAGSSTVDTNNSINGVSGGLGTSAYARLGNAGTYHVIANPNHITIIQDSTRVHAIWETSVTEAHTFYNIPPFVQFNTASVTTGSYYESGFNGTAVASPQNLAANNTIQYSPNIQLFNFTAPSSGTNYGTFKIGEIGYSGYSQAGALGIQPGINLGWQRGTTVGTTGGTKNLVTPIYFQAYTYGLAATFVTGVCPIYMTRGNAATAGDTMTINGVTYTYFPCGGSGYAQNYGLVMLTS